MARDPVCGMQVNEDRAAGTSEYQGQTYASARRAASSSSTKTQRVIQDETAQR